MGAGAGRPAMTLPDLFGIVNLQLRKPRSAGGSAPLPCGESFVPWPGTDAEGSLAAAVEDRREGGAG
jgi:hypothetical protein